jgi:hypothetical protein
MIYVDTYPGLRLAEEQAYSTFAHELQHLINFATTVQVGRKNQEDSYSVMDTWIDEGLSSQAEHIYFGKNLDDKCRLFYEDENGTIAKGNNFFVWGNNPSAILDEYSTVYLFFRWLYLQANDSLKSRIFLDIETSKSSDYTIITNVAKEIHPDWQDQDDEDVWDTLLRSWLAANYYPENSEYGYKDPYFYSGENAIKVKPLTEITSVQLYPGEGVYSIINSSFTPRSGGGRNIRYAGLSDDLSSSIITESPYTPYTSNVLLTYNVSTNSNEETARPETGYLTGSSTGSSSPSVRTATEARAPAGPYVIDARDYNSGRILGRNK